MHLPTPHAHAYHQPHSLRAIVMQEMNEERYNRQHIDAKIRAALADNPDTQARIAQGVQLVADWRAGTYYPAKMARLAQLAGMDLPTLVTDLFVGIAYVLRPALFTSVSAQLASRLKFSDKADAITTVAELLAILCATDAFDITKASRTASLMVVSRIPLANNLVTFIEESQYLPPMVCPPRHLVSNYSSGYLTHNDSLILGGAINHHDGDLCLDVLNIMNQVPLQLDTAFLCQVEEQPTHALDTQDKVDQWQAYKQQSYKFYSLMAQCGNRLWFTHKVDKRGRIYSQGYHLNPQGSAFKKSCLELATEELVDGVPA
jgi:hypothetical protein